jgi:uncharacterized integral membrane protein
MQETPTEHAGMSRRTQARLIGGAVGVVLFVVFVVQNQDSARVHFLFWDRHMRLAWALIVAGILGFIVGLALPRLRRWL